MKGWGVKLLKLVLVAGLMWWLISSQVHFDDRKIVTVGDADTVTSGEIQGPWNTPTVEFQPIGENEPVQILVPGLQADGSKVSVSPGLPTYWRNLDPWLFGAGAFCYFLTVLIAGSRWWWLLRVNGMDVRLREALRYTWIGIFFNSVVPGATGGDLIKALYIMKRCPGHRVPALVSVIVDRVLGLASLAILGAVVVLFDLDKFGFLAAVIWAVMLCVALLGTVAFSRRLRQLLRINVLLEKLPHRIAHVLKLIDQAVFFYRGHKGVIVGSLLTGIINHFVSVLSVVLIGQALGIGVTWLEYFVMIPIINIISAVPLGPNGWGIGEASYSFFFGRYSGLAQTLTNGEQVMAMRGFVLSVLYRLHLTLWSLLGGLFLLFEKDRVTKDDIEREVDREEHDDDVPPGPA